MNCDIIAAKEKYESNLALGLGDDTSKLEVTKKIRIE